MLSSERSANAIRCQLTMSRSIISLVQVVTPSELCGSLVWQLDDHDLQLDAIGEDLMPRMRLSTSKSFWLGSSAQQKCRFSFQCFETSTSLSTRSKLFHWFIYDSKQRWKHSYCTNKKSQNSKNLWVRRFRHTSSRTIQVYIAFHWRGLEIA